MSEQHSTTHGERNGDGAQGRHRGPAASGEDRAGPPHGRHRRPGGEPDGGPAD
ncbi:hypothetical protein IF129_02880 [Streptomyces chumphonensis]|uniref:Uncharacterized protein n=1 Tax=Streptomyces chumphonensis TaxID=1214925 RepID=A0A927EVW5_9ACTN|nr:hypothetical protein [Streptomyces chumphonensis]MBD3930521.1 hypothetical protein [Streptomyces chumphonensis]